MIKILVAEDEIRSRNAFVSRLRNILGETALIEAASDGNETIMKVEQIQPELVFMDIEMPLRSGLDAATIVKQRRPETHIVFLTAYDRFDYAVGALRSGGEEYLLKPVSEIDLRETLQKFFLVKTQSTPEASVFETALNVWVRQHYAENVALKDAAAGMGMSSFYFSRQIKATLGKTWIDYITEYRIKKAKKLLLVTELSISDVGKSVGYPDSNYFTKVFKRVAGCTPTVYRSTPPLSED